MTVRNLQKAIVNDLQQLFSGITYQTPGGYYSPDWDSETPAVQGPIKVFRQFLPMQYSETAEEPYPYILVRVSSGSTEDEEQPHKIAVILLVGIFDDTDANNGMDTVLEVIEKILFHYKTQPALREFVCEKTIEWAVQDEPSFPYFFGSMGLTFDAPAPRVEFTDLV